MKKLNSIRLLGITVILLAIAALFLILPQAPGDDISETSAPGSPVAASNASSIRSSDSEPTDRPRTQSDVSPDPAASSAVAEPGDTETPDSDQVIFFGRTQSNAGIPVGNVPVEIGVSDRYGQGTLHTVISDTAGWRRISVCQWSLGYRNDERNWRFLHT